MIDKKNILKMATHVFKKGQGYPDRRLMHPHREWLVGILLLVAVICLGGLKSIQMYTKYSDVSARMPETKIEIVTYDEAAVAHALEIFRTRVAVYGVLTERPVILEAVPELSTATSAQDAVQVDLIAE